ncbi:Class 3 lipase protein [Aphelenchoides besseyi]|nr:Class 3 lipase protein [Aphelenchoides besseyi]
MISQLLCFFVVQLLAIAAAQPYDEKMARFILPLASAAYSQRPEICVRKLYLDAKLIKRFDVLCDESADDTCSGYLALLNGDKAIVVAFRGTTTDMQLKLEGDDTLLIDDFYGMGKVHRYFYRAFITLWNDGGMKNEFESLTKQYPDYSIIVTGHSLGAAISSLASAAILKERKFTNPKVYHYNYGQPRVGDADFAVAHTQLIPDFYRVTHGRDGVTVVPDTSLGFVHHAGEVWYNNTMEPGAPYVYCLTDNQAECSGVKRDQWGDHRYYFGIKVPVYGRHGCSSRIF